MKKIIFSLLIIYCTQPVIAQCIEPFTVPYIVDVEDAAVPDLPDCMFTNYLTFDSVEVFESISGPVSGFNGKLLAYNTATDSPGGGAVQPTVGATLTTYNIQLEEGTEYIISYRYANSDASKSINSFGVRLQQPANNFYFDLTNHLNITGATVTNYISQPFTVPSSGIYSFDFTVQSLGNQGSLYLDEINVQEADVMSVKEMSLSGMLAYPNPTSGRLTISNTSQIDMLKICTISGQILCNEPVNALKHEVDISNFSTGMYMIFVYTGRSIEKIKIFKK